MVSKLSRLLTSEVLNVVAGLDDKKFRIHGELLASYSEILWQQVSNKLCSRDDREIVIDGHDGPTVGRFAEFLYTGNYEAPRPVQVLDISRKGTTEDNLSSPPGVAFTEDIATQKCETKPESLAGTNGKSTNPEPETCGPSDPPPSDMPPGYDAPESPASELPTTNPSNALKSTSTVEDTLETTSQQDLPEMRSDRATNFDPSQFDFKDAFLAHGKICALAHSFDIEPLEKLAIVRLEDVFRKITLVAPGTPVVSNFAALVEYAYEKPTSERLREALLKFFSPNVSVLRGVEIQKLVSHGGDLASDLMKIVCDKLEDTEQENGQSLLEVKTLNTKLNLAGKSQDHAEAQADLGSTLEGERMAFRIGILGQEEDLTIIQQELREALERVEKERSQKEDWMARHHACESVMEGLEMQNELLMIENAAIKGDLDKASDKTTRYEKKLRELESEIYGS